MLHEDPFEFMRLGSALERAGQTARILDVKHHSIGPGERDVELPVEAAQWLATLRSCAAVEPFYKRPENTLSGASVARFLLFDRVFPGPVRIVTPAETGGRFFLLHTPPLSGDEARLACDALQAAGQVCFRINR